MSDLRDRFAEVDVVGAPDVWPEAVARAGRLGPRGGGVADAVRPRRKALTVALAFAVFAVSASFAWVAWGPHRPPPSEEPIAPAPSWFDLDAVPEGWSHLPFAPPEARSNAATAWTGDVFLTFGGYVYSGYSDEEMSAEGFRFDPATGATSPMASAPISARGSAAAAWTGSELLVWGGTDGTYRGGEPGMLGDGAAYDPITDEWRTLPPAPISPRVPLSVWTGREMIVWGTATRVDDRPVDGAAYDPGTNTWRPIADGPLELTDAAAVWSGEEMYVFGAALHGGNFPETPTAIGAAYDPRNDRWRALPPSEMSPNANNAVWTGEDLVVWDYGSRGQVYDPAADAWRSLPDVPIDDCEDSPRGLGGSGIVFGEFCGEYVVLRDRVWHNVTRPELVFAPVVSFLAGEVVVSFGYSSDAYGPGEEVRAFAYRPPSSFACGGFGGIEGSELARAVAERLALLRSDRPEGLVRHELDQLLTASGAASFGDDRPLVGNIYNRETLRVEDLGDGAWRVVMRIGKLAGGEFGEELTLRSGTNLAGEGCPLLVDGSAGFDLETPFIPASERIGNRFVATLTFPDGSRAVVSFPEGPIRVLHEGVQPNVAYLWQGDPPPRFAISFIHGSREAASLLVPGTPEEVLPTADGGVAELVAADETSWWLVYEVPGWTVAVPVAVREDAAIVAAAIAVTQDGYGFPVVRADAPLALSEESGEGLGPVLTFGDAQSESGRADLWIEGCVPGPPELDGASGLACFADGRLTLEVNGSRRFAEDLLSGFRVESFTPAT